MRMWLRLLTGLALAGAMVCFGIGTLAQAGQRPTFVSGDVVVWAKSGVSADTVREAANGANCDLVRMTLMPDVYLLRVKMIGTPTSQDTLNAVDALARHDAFRWVGPNTIKYPLDTTPDDPRYREQWHLPLMNLPQAWDIHRGSQDVVVAVIDTGVDTTHPDLRDRLLPGYNSSGTGSTNDPTDTNGHGTHVIGIIGATTNNGLGVAGVTYEGVKVLPIKAGDAGFTLTAIVDGLTFAERQGANIVNLSLGSPAPSDTPPAQLPPDEAKIMQMARNGVLFSIAAGNSFTDGNPPFAPAYLAQLDDHIICVAACDSKKKQAPYSEARPYTTISAPGGNTGAGQSEGVLSTYLTSAGGYAFEQGTSMAAPNAAGVMALVLSAGAEPAEMKSVLTTTADHSMLTTVPDNAFGYGVIDAYAALLKAGISVTVLEPEGTGGKASAGGIVRNPAPVETLAPVIRVAVSQITPDNLTLTLNGQIVTGWTLENISRTVKDNAGNDVPVVYEAVIRDNVVPAGQNIIDVSGVKPGPPDRVVTDTRKFMVIPRQIPAGRSLISIPYREDGATPESYFGTTFRLARWLPLEARYAVYSPMLGTDPGASFTPPDTVPHLDGSAVSGVPVGLAFWADLESLKPVLTKGQPLPTRSYVIPLRGRGGLGVTVSWNMIGCPFPYDVPFNALLVDTPEGRITIAAAVSRGYVLPNLYSYDGSTGYTFRTLPDGALRAWEGHWMGVTSSEDIALVVPPVRITRSRSQGVTAPRDGWRLQLQASGSGLQDTFNFIGVQAGASNGQDLLDVPKPPMISPFVSVGVEADSQGRSVLLAQDIRSSTGAQTWKVALTSDTPNSEVTLRWNSVGSWPSRTRLLLTDAATGQTIDMRTRSSITFQSGSQPAPRSLTVSAKPISATALRISNVAVRTSGTRGVGSVQVSFTLSSTAAYEVRVLGVDGRPVGVVSSRAAATGDVQLVWIGKDNAGRNVPAGTYLVQIRAIDDDGDVVRVIQPFSLVR